MESTNVTVSSRGYIVLPASLRKEMNIKAGTKILLHTEITVNRRISHVKLCIADEPCRGYFDTKKASFNFSRPAILIPF